MEDAGAVSSEGSVLRLREQVEAEVKLKYNDKKSIHYSQVVTLRNEAGETEDHVLVPLREMLERFGCAGKNGRGPGGPDGAGEHSRSRPRKLQANLRLLKAATSAEASLERQRAKSSRGFWHNEDMMESLQDHSEMFFRTADDGDFGYHEERDALMSGGGQRLTASSRSTPNLLESGTRLNLGPQLRDDINHMRTTLSCSGAEMKEMTTTQTILTATATKTKKSKPFAEMSVAEKRGVFVGKWLNTEQEGFEQVLRANGANMVQVVGAKMVNYGVGKSAHEFFLSSSRKNGTLDLLKEVHTGGLAGSHAFKFQKFFLGTAIR
eukprot:g3253.t1